MQLQLDSNNFIIGYGTKGEMINAIDIDDSILPKCAPEDLLKYKYENNQFILDDSEFIKSKSIMEATFELADIDIWFSKYDYYPNKIICGEWTADDPRFIKYLSDRKVKRARRDELLVILGQPVL